MCIVKEKYTCYEIRREIESLQNTFEIVRVVDPVQRAVYENEKREKAGCEKIFCYEIWGKGKPCENCTAARALLSRGKCVKVEFIRKKAYLVIARYLELEGRELVLELVTKLEFQEIRGGKSPLYDEVYNLHHNIYRDELTGVYNRRFLNERLPLLLKQAEYQKGQIGLALVDIDYFKEMNDTYGHLAGDEGLRAAVQAMEDGIKPEYDDFVARLGGDEFIIVYHGISPEIFAQKLEELVERIQGMPVGRGNVEKEEQTITVSIGGAMNTEVPPSDMEGLLDAADRRLYMAKRQGRNKAVYREQSGL